jgi:uncharacterized membrane protein YbhN (UPF0104 family)
VGRVLRNVAVGFSDLARRGRFGRVMAVSLLSQGSGVAAFIVVCSAMGAADPLLAGAVLYAATTTATVVSLTPGGLGITELVAALAGSVIDVGGGFGILVVLIIRATGLVSVIALAGIGVVSGHRGDAINAPSDAP